MSEPQKGEILKGKQLRFAAKNRVPVFCVEHYYSAFEPDRVFCGQCIMEPAKNGFYIGNTDIDPNLFGDDDLVDVDFGDGYLVVYAIAKEKYE